VIKIQYFEPFNSYIDMNNFKLKTESKLVKRKLSDMSTMYLDQKAVKEVLTEDPLIYEFSTIKVPEENGHLLHCISKIYSGKIGSEYFMTKGHFHEVENTAEIYLTLKGSGKLVMQTNNEDCKVIEMKKGSISYIPPYWAHRTVNTGNEPLIFFCVYRGDAGHNYGIIEKNGMKKLIQEKDNKVVITQNPKY